MSDKDFSTSPAPDQPDTDEPRNDRGETRSERDARRRRKDRSTASFWRACRFLYPYRRLVLVSVTCAFFVGAAFTGGLTSMLPMMRVLLNGETVQTWANREVAERRIGVKLTEDAGPVRVLSVKDDGPAAAAGIRSGDILESRIEGGTAIGPIAQPGADKALLEVGGRPVELRLPPLPWYLVWGQNVARHVPVHPIWAIASVFGCVALLAVVSNVIKFFQEYFSDKAAIMAVQDIRRRMYDHVLHVPMSHFGARGTSDITSRLTQDSQELAQGFKTVLGQTIQEPIKAAFAFGLAVWVSWKLTLFIVLFAPVMFAIIKTLGKKMRRANRRALINSSSMLGQIEGTLIGIRVVKGASAERFERRRYSRIMDRLVQEQLRMSRIDAFSQPTIETLTLFVVGGVVLVASYMVLIQHSLEATSFILVMACLAGIGDSMRRLSKVNNVLQKSNAAATRIFEVLDLPTEKPRALVVEEKAEDKGTRGRGDKGTAAAALAGANGNLTTDNGQRTTCAAQRPRIKLPALRREVRFENITFGYPNSTTPALVDVSLTVPKGRSVAVVGRNGSGKTTLLALLPRFYDPQRGRVLIDGVDVKDATLRSLRSQISIVTQDSVIFPGTIAENIAYGQPLADRAEVIEAAKRAFAHDFILEKPQGYDTMLGELGGQLSGGQKQRICIARAIFRKAPILILDEATSQVDAESEHLIQQAIDGLMHDAPAAGSSYGGPPTTFVIAHRFSTILSADVIVVMDRGRIIGQGKHDELLRTCETYAQLYERQLIAAPAAVG